MTALHRILAGTLLSMVVVLAVYDLERVPPLWWDEGWTLSVARNWQQLGHYGRYLSGQPTTTGLEAAFPLTAALRLSFHFFGVGIYQARIVMVLFMCGTLFVLYYLAYRLYNPAVAWTTLVSVLLLPADHSLHPIFAGRQVLAEVPSLFFLLASYVCLLSLPCRKLFACILAATLAALAINVKIQALPFWMLSMLVVMVLSAHAGLWRNSILIGVTLVLSLLVSQLLPWLWRYFLQEPLYGRGILSGLFEVTTLVGSVPARMFSGIVFVLFGFPTFLGLCFAGRRFYVERDWLVTHTGLMRFSLFVLVSTWVAWYLVFSVSWIRYLFPATFVGSIFVAVTIYQLTKSFNYSFMAEQLLRIFKRLEFDLRSLGVLLTIVVICAFVPRTVTMFYRLYVLDADASVHDVARYLNTQTPPGSLVETYDSELFFLLDRPYHYPPDQVHVELIRRKFLYDDFVSIEYDPLRANPDFLVVGPHSKQWRLYDRVLRAGEFHLVHTYNRYNLYERVR